MRSINEKPIELEDGRSMTILREVATATEVYYGYPFPQDAVFFENKGSEAITLKVGTSSYVVSAGASQNVAGRTLGFSVVSDSRTPFTATAWGAKVYAESVSIEDFGARAITGFDNTAAIQAAIKYAQSNGGLLVKVPKGTYEVHGTLLIDSDMILEGESQTGSILKHLPPDGTLDCLTIRGQNNGRLTVRRLGFKGAFDEEIGKDLIRVIKGDYVTLEDLFLDTPSRHGLMLAPNGQNLWIENLYVKNVKIQTPLTDGIQFNVPTSTFTFINQCTFINCEVRAAQNRALTMINNNTADVAAKISNVRFINCELAVETGPDPSKEFVLMQGSSAVGVIENIAFEDCAIEDTQDARTGVGMVITGLCNGFFSFKNNIIFGTTGDTMSGVENFSYFDVWDVRGNTYVPHRVSHVGIWYKHRTASLAPSASEALTEKPIPNGSMVMGFVQDQLNADKCYATFICQSGKRLTVLDSFQCTVTLDTGTGIITVQNNAPTSTGIEVELVRFHHDAPF